MTQLLQHPKLGHINCAICGRNITCQRIGGLAQMRRQGGLNQAQKRIQTVLFRKEIGDKRTDVRDPIPIIFQEDRQQFDNRADLAEL